MGRAPIPPQRACPKRAEGGWEDPVHTPPPPWAVLSARWVGTWPGAANATGSRGCQAGSAAGLLSGALPHGHVGQPGRGVGDTQGEVCVSPKARWSALLSLRCGGPEGGGQGREKGVPPGRTPELQRRSGLAMVGLGAVEGGGGWQKPQEKPRGCLARAWPREDQGVSTGSGSGWAAQGHVALWPWGLQKG